MSKTIIIILGIIAIVGLGSWFYLKSITQKSDINIINTGSYPVMMYSPYPSGSTPSSSARPTTGAKASTRPDTYIGPANRVE